MSILHQPLIAKMVCQGVRCLDDLSMGKQADVDFFINHPNCGPIKGGIKDLWTRI